MSDTTSKQVQKGVAELRKLRDEIKVQLHLAGMDAKAFWEGFEPKLADVERKLGSGVDASAHYADVVLDELTKAFARVRDRFKADTKN